ncbi:MAG: hypothetical protein ACYCQJ_14810 [Nitrososphaerales archaeon]
MHVDGWACVVMYLDDMRDIISLWETGNGIVRQAIKIMALPWAKVHPLQGYELGIVPYTSVPKRLRDLFRLTIDRLPGEFYYTAGEYHVIQYEREGFLQRYVKTVDNIPLSREDFLKVGDEYLRHGLSVSYVGGHPAEIMCYDVMIIPGHPLVYIRDYLFQHLQYFTPSTLAFIQRHVLNGTRQGIIDLFFGHYEKLANVYRESYNQEVEYDYQRTLVIKRTDDCTGYHLENHPDYLLIRDDGTIKYILI